MDNSILNRIRGCLYGQAIGDALGFGTEALTKLEVKTFYPDGLKNYNNFYQDARRKGWPMGAWTDDTEMMLSILDCIVDNPVESISPTVLAPYFLTFYNNWGHTCGTLTRKSLNFAPPIYQNDPISVSKMVWHLKGENNAPNGGLMRTSIIGLWPYNVVENAINVCQMTHFDKRCVCSCVIASLIIYNLVWNNKSLEVGELYAISSQYDSECRKWIESAYKNNDISELHLDDKETLAYTYRALSAALWAYFHATDFESGLLAIVNEGGDADTNAAIACAILGAKFGYSSIPCVYIEGLHNKQGYYNKVTYFISAISSRYDT